MNNDTTYSVLKRSNSTAATNLQAYANGVTAYINYDEALYTQVSALAAAPSVINRLEEMQNLYPNTIFSLDKDLYFPHDMYVRLTFGGVQKLYWCSTVAGDPTGNGASTPGNANVPITNLYFHLACEQNQTIIDSIVTKYNHGSLKYMIPYTITNRNQGQGTSQNVQLQFNKAYGKKLMCNLHTVWNTLENQGNYGGFDNSNTAANQKVLQYQTWINSIPIQYGQLRCLSNGGTDDFRENSIYLKNNAYFGNSTIYQNCWFHLDQFYIPPTEGNPVPEENLDVGLEINENVVWQFISTTANVALVHLDFSTFVREFGVDASGPVLMN
jgi:hypothetical protein